MKKTFLLLPVFLIISQFCFSQDVATIQDFFVKFPNASLPFDADTIAKQKRLTWEFYQFLPELENIATEKSAPVYPEPVAQFEKEGNIVVLYNIVTGLDTGDKDYYISIFDKDGSYIKSQKCQSTTIASAR